MARMVKKLSKFESPYGLTITAKESLAPQIDLTKIPRRYHPALKEIIDPKQWDYPNIWPPLEYQTVVGLLQYGFVKEAQETMEKSVRAHAAIFRKHGVFVEKINAETGDRSTNYHYELQPGFGWTNAIFYRYIEMLDAIENNEQLYVNRKGEPPYELALLH